MKGKVKIKYKIKKDVVVQGKGLGFIIYLNDEHTPDPYKYELLYRKLQSLGYDAMKVDKSLESIGLGVYLGTTPGKILYTTVEADSNQWLEVPYDVALYGNLKVEIHEGEV